MDDGDIKELLEILLKNTTTGQAAAIFAAVNHVMECGHGEDITIRVKDGHLDLLAITKTTKINQL